MLFLLADGESHSKLANLTPNSCRSHYFGCFKVERSVYALSEIVWDSMVYSAKLFLHIVQHIIQWLQPSAFFRISTDFPARIRTTDIYRLTRIC